MRLLRLAEFLVSHDELQCLLPVQDVPEKYVMYGDSDWGIQNPGGARRGPLNNSVRIPSPFSHWLKRA